MLEISSYFFHYTSPRQNLTDEAKNPIFKSIFFISFYQNIFSKTRTDPSKSYRIRPDPNLLILTNFVSFSFNRNLLATWIICGFWDWFFYFSPLKDKLHKYKVIYV